LRDEHNRFIRDGPETELGVARASEEEAVVTRMETQGENGV
jgi:hypothetical protein